MNTFRVGPTLISNCGIFYLQKNNFIKIEDNSMNVKRIKLPYGISNFKMLVRDGYSRGGSTRGDRIPPLRGG